MDIDERRRKILELLGSQSYVTVDDFARCLGVSAVTVRSDLSALEKEGEIVRTHGGAMIGEKKSKIRFISDTMTEYEKEKKAIAKKAASLIQNGSTVSIDSGSTTTRIVEFLDDKKFNVVTNNILVIDALKDNPKIESLTIIGGQLRRESMGIIGPMANDDVKDINVDIYFMGSAAYTAESLSSTSITESEVKRNMIKAADKVVFLADSSKFGKRAFSRTASRDVIDTFITDKIDPAFRELLENQGIEVIIADE